MAFPLFPLDLVLLPGVPLPLHIFEPRYREMIGRCISDGTPFGVVLATDGAVVGGFAGTAPVGCAAEIAQFRRLDDGRILLVARGTRRFRILERLPDDPFPRADVEWLGPTDTSGVTPADLGALRRLVRRYIGLAAEADEIDEWVELELDDDPEAAVDSAIAVARLSNSEKQMMLETDALAVRLDLLRERLVDETLRLEDAFATR